MELAIRKVRESLGVSVPELSEKTGITKNKIWNYESGRTVKIDLEDLCSIADALGVSLDLLVRGKEKDRPLGRSKEEMLKMYDDMSMEELSLLAALIQLSLEGKRFQAHLDQGHQA